MPDKKVIIIAGPNGAGKTTFALEYLPNEADCPVFVNADLIAAGHLFYWRKKITMKESPEKKSPNPDDTDVEGVTAALIRAARRAHLIAHQAGTGVVVMRGGKVVEIEPDPEMYGNLLSNISNLRERSQKH